MRRNEEEVPLLPPPVRRRLERGTTHLRYQQASVLALALSVCQPQHQWQHLYSQRELSTVTAAAPRAAWSAPAPAAAVPTAPLAAVATVPAAAVLTVTASVPAVTTATAPTTALMLAGTQTSLRASDGQHLSAPEVQQKQLRLTSVGVSASNQEQEGRGSSLNLERSSSKEDHQKSAAGTKRSLFYQAWKLG